MFANILMPVDGSRGSSKALHLVAEVAKSFGSQTYLLFVAEPPGMLYPPGLSYVDLMENTLKWGEELVQESSRRLREEGVTRLEEHVREGHPAQVILDAVREWEINLVVMGTHGRRGLDRVLLGSVAEEVVRRCPVPVLTVRMRNDA